MAAPANEHGSGRGAGEPVAGGSEPGVTDPGAPRPDTGSTGRGAIPWSLAIRDGALVGLTLALWVVDATTGTGAGHPSGLAWVAGVLAAVCGYLLHEWGHLAGALLAGGVVHPAAGWGSAFLFRFDVTRNDRRQFVWMSAGGFAATAVVAAGFVAALPREALAGRVALGLTALGLVATAVLELPPFFRVLRGGPLPRGSVYVAEARGR